MRVLIIKVSSMGDILHTLPSLTDAALALPGIRFDWIVEEEFAKIPSWHETVDRVIPVSIRRWSKNWFSKSTKLERALFYETIQSIHYNTIIDAQGLLKISALITYLANGIKHGMNWKTAREPISSLFYNRRHYIPKGQHAVERTRELFAKSCCYPKPRSLGDYAIAQKFISLYNGPPYLLFLHTTSRTKKLWPERHWRKLINLLRMSGFRIKLPWGKPHEQNQAMRLAEGFDDHIDVLPRLNLDDLAKQIASASAVVSVDTGLSHLTAALGRPNITLYGPTNPTLIGGYGKNQYICQPKYSSKLSDISADMVFSQLKTLLAIEQVERDRV